MPKQITIPGTLTLESCEFALPQSASGEATTKAPCKMTARSGRPINLPYIGAVVHDLAGMRPPVTPLNVDYCHNQSELIGTCDKVDIATGDLTMEGQVFSVRDGDRASEVLARAAQGQKYQMSIKWDDGQIEELDDGKIATVNGRQVNGPALIVRQWTLRGVAVCAYGADMNTSAEFAAGSQQTFQIKDRPMSEDKKTSADIRAELQAQAQDYFSRFGGELGAKWFAASKPLAECYGEFTAQLQTKHAGELAALQAKHAGELATEKKRADDLATANSELQAKVESLGKGGGAEKPVSGGPAPGEKGNAKPFGEWTAAEKALGQGTNLGRLANGIKMPAA